MKSIVNAIFALIVCLSLAASVVSCSKKEEESEGSAVEQAIEGSMEKAEELKDTAQENAAEADATAEEIAPTEGEAKTEEPATEPAEAKEEMKEEPVVAAAPKGDAAKGKEKFETICASCHGLAGKGDGVAAAALNPKPRDLSDAAYVSTLTNDHMFKVIKEGGASVGKSPLMPAWGGALTDDDIHNVVAHIHRSLCKCEPK